MRSLASLAVLILLSPTSALSFDSAKLKQLQESRSCFSCDLSGANLSGVDLSGGRISSAEMNGVNLSGANLTDVSMSGTQLEKSLLTGVRFDGARLSGVQFTGAVVESGALDTAAKICNVTMPNGEMDNSRC